MLSRRVIAFRLGKLEPRFVMHALYAGESRNHLERWGRGTTVPRILKPRLVETPIPVAPLAEQNRIIERVDECLAWAKSLQAKLRGILPTLSTLNQSILAKAFRGELVPQDPNDEPASVLLERIRAEREKAAPKKKKRGSRKARQAKSEPPKTKQTAEQPTPSPEPAPNPTPPASQTTTPPNSPSPKEPLADWMQGSLFTSASSPSVNSSRSNGNGELSTNAAQILGCLREAEGKALARADVLERTSVSSAEWTKGIKELLGAGLVTREGQKRGARYRVAEG